MLMTQLGLSRPIRSLRVALSYWWPYRLTMDFANRPAIWTWLWWSWFWRSPPCAKCEHHFYRPRMIWLPFMGKLYCEDCLPGVVTLYAAEKEAEAIASYDHVTGDF